MRFLSWISGRMPEPRRPPEGDRPAGMPQGDFRGRYGFGHRAHRPDPRARYSFGNIVRHPPIPADD